MRQRGGMIPLGDRSEDGEGDDRKNKYSSQRIQNRKYFLMRFHHV